MAKKGKARSIPSWGRSQAALDAETPHSFAADVPLGNNSPTVVQGVMWGGMPNRSRQAKGPLRQYRGKYT